MLYYLYRHNIDPKFWIDRVKLMKRHLRLLLIAQIIISVTLISLAEPVMVSAKDMEIRAGYIKKEEVSGHVEGTDYLNQLSGYMDTDPAETPVKSMSLESATGTESTEATDGAVPTEEPAPTEVPIPTEVPVPTEMPVPTEVPVSTEEPIPTVNPEPTESAEPTVTLPPVPTQAPNPTEEPAVTPEPTITPFVPKTLQVMAEYDYVGNSVTQVSTKKLSIKELQKQVNKYGTLVRDGMPYKEYVEAMSYQWKDCTDYKSKPEKITVDITKTMDYKTYVDTLKKLSRYDGVYLYKIGKSTEGRDLYAVEIDVKSNKKKNVLMFTGSIHAREFAGGTYLVKSLVDLVQKAQTDQNTMKLLQNNKYVAVPIVNVDVREAIIKNQSKWTVSGGEIWKAYINGADGNRNFPGLSWGELTKGNILSKKFLRKSAYAFYPGDYAGSNSETKALMKFLYHYIVVEKAKCLLDMHQQGSVIYAGKDWAPNKQNQNSINFRKKVLDLLNQGASGRKYKVIYEYSSGLSGNGATITDYSCALAFGAKFSPAFGILTFTNGKKETTLMEAKSMKNLKYKVDMPNPDFRSITVEIGYGRNYLGNSASTRKLIAAEYKKYNFDKLLTSLPNLMK